MEASEASLLSLLVVCAVVAVAAAVEGLGSAAWAAEQKTTSLAADEDGLLASRCNDSYFGGGDAVTVPV